MMPDNAETVAGHPKPKCHFGRDHRWTAFVHIAGRYCCETCGVEDDEAWWGEDGRTYIGPAEAVICDMSGSGWLLRKPQQNDGGQSQ